MRCPSSDVSSQPQTGEGPAGGRGEEVAIGGPGVTRGCHTRSSPQHVLVDHELAVVLADRPGSSLEPGVGAVGRRGPLPDVARRCGEGGAGDDRRRMKPGLVEEVTGPASTTASSWSTSTCCGE